MDAHITPKRILLIALGAYGDCLMTTAIAKQIKQDHPGCHLTWAISSKFASILENNPDVDCVWAVPCLPGESLTGVVWQRVKDEAARQQEAGELDLVVDAQLYPDNMRCYDGTTRSSMFRCYPGKVTVPVTPVLQLTEGERGRARTYAHQQQLTTYRHVILFECAPSSGQSVLTQPMGIAIAERIVAAHHDAIVVISTHLRFDSPHARILDGYCLSFRENAALSHFCTLFVGCSSGITWALTSEAAKPLRMVLFLNRRAVASGFASAAYDLAHWGLETEHILENGSEDVACMAGIVHCALDDFADARARYHQAFKPSFWDWLYFVDCRSLRGMAGSLETVRQVCERNGFAWHDCWNVRPLFRVIGRAWNKGWRGVIRQIVPAAWRPRA